MHVIHSLFQETNQPELKYEGSTTLLPVPNVSFIQKLFCPFPKDKENKPQDLPLILVKEDEHYAVLGSTILKLDLAVMYRPLCNGTLLSHLKRGRWKAMGPLFSTSSFTFQESSRAHQGHGDKAYLDNKTL